MTDDSDAVRGRILCLGLGLALSIGRRLEHVFSGKQLLLGFFVMVEMSLNKL